MLKKKDLLLFFTILFSTTNLAMSQCNVSGGTLTGGPFEFCVDDGNPDVITPGAIHISGAYGSLNKWVITDVQGEILAFPSTPYVPNFDGAGVGRCLIWNLSYEQGTSGLEIGQNADDIQGCFSLSNPISVFRLTCCGQNVCSTPDLTPWDGSINADHDVNSNNIMIGNAQLMLSRSFSGHAIANENKINSSQTQGDVGIRLGVAHGVGMQNSMLAEYSFSEPVCGLDFTIWDIDFTDKLIVEAFVNGQTVPYTVSPGSCVDVWGNALLPNGFYCEFPVNGKTSHRAEITVNGCLDELRIRSFLQRVYVTSGGYYVTGGSYTVVFGDGCTNQMDIDGGMLTGGPFDFCAGDGVADNIPAGGITLSGNSGTNSQWVVTDDQGTILGLPPSPDVVDFDGAGTGTCLVWHLSFEDGLIGAEMGMNANDLQGCYSLSNPISVIRTQPAGGTLTGGPFEFCAGDGVADNIPSGSITLSGNSGTNSQWVVTDDQGTILGLPPTPDVVDFDGAGTGTCLVWHLSFEDGLVGAEMGMNANELEGCYSLSNPISVLRNDPNGGDLFALDAAKLNRTIIANRASGTISVINSDTDQIENTITLPNNGEPMYVVYSEVNNTILVGDYGGRVVGYDGLTLDFKGTALAGDGVFHMWLSPDNKQLWVNNELDKTISVIDPGTFVTLSTFSIPMDLVDLGYKPHDVIVMPNNAAAFVSMLGPLAEDYVVKYSTSTFQEIDRVAVGLDPHLSLTSANPYLYVASQGSGEVKVFNRSDLSEVTTVSVPNAHGLGMSPEGDYLYIGNIAEGGINATYTLDLVTNTLVGSPVDAPFAAPHNYAVTSDNQKLYITHSGGASDQVSVYNLSPSPSLLTTLTVENNPFGLVTYTYQEKVDTINTCAGDGISDAFDVSLSNVSGPHFAWVITDASGVILALPPGPPFDLEGAGAGTCLIWHLSFSDGLLGATVGQNANDLQGCHSLSNPITVVRTQPEGGLLAGGPFEFCVGDSAADNIPAGAITLTGNTGSNSQWVVTDEQGNILGLPPMPSVVNFEGAGEGTCLIWHLSFEDGLLGAEVGMNANDLQGCYSLSNPISVFRNDSGAVCDPNCNVVGGELAGGPFSFCVGDGVADNIPSGAISLSGNNGANSQWIVTDDQGTILGLPPMPSVVDFDGAGVGTCLIWHLSFEDGLLGASVGLNARDLQGCYSLSNPIEVYRSTPDGGVLTAGVFEFCVGDGVADNISAGAISLIGNSGSNSQWVVTDDQGTILGLPPMPSVVDFDGAGEGTCLIWHLSFEDGLLGAEVGMNTNDLLGCYSLSNPIEVFRTNCIDHCPLDRVVNGNPISAGTYRAVKTISSYGSVSNGPVNLTAKESIEMLEGFEVRRGNLFQVYIEGCDNAQFD